MTLASVPEPEPSAAMGPWQDRLLDEALRQPPRVRTILLALFTVGALSVGAVKVAPMLQGGDTATGEPSVGCVIVNSPNARCR